MLEIDKDNNIKLTRGDTAYINLDPLINSDGTVYEFQEGDKIYFRLRTNTYRLLTKELEIDLSTNTATLSIDPLDTANFPLGVHKYELELVTVLNEHFTFIANKKFILDRELEGHG